MDSSTSHSLVPLSAEQGSLVRVTPVLVAELDSGPDLFAWLWQRFCKLAVLFFLLLLLLRRLRLQLIELRLQANYWRVLHQRAVQRETKWKERVQQLEGELRELKRRFYGRKSETSSTIPSPPDTDNQNNNGKKRSRGQQRGSTGHGRRCHDQLDTAHEECALPKDQQCCAACGQPFVEIPGTADGDILEIDVRAHRRRYQRHRYRRP